MHLFRFNMTTALTTPLFMGPSHSVAAMQKCEHEFADIKATAVTVPEHPGCTMVMQQCRCGAVRTKLTGSEHDLNRALGQS